VVATALARDLRADQIALADRVTQEMLLVFGALNFKAIDLSAPGFIEAAIAVAARGHRAGSGVGADMYLSMRRQAGVAGPFQPVLPEFDAAQLRRDLTVLGPIAAKKLMADGVMIPDAAQRVFTMTAGRVSKNALAGVRDTISGSTVQDDEAVAYARQTSSGACDFCIRMAENTYRSAFSAIYSSGRRKRNRKAQPAGSTFHDHCRCTLVTLFKGEIAPGAKERASTSKAWAEADRNGVSFRDFAKQAGLDLGF